VTQGEVTEFIKKTLKLQDVDGASALGRNRGWDSMDHVELMLAFETEYGVTIPPELYGELTSVAMIVGWFREHGLLDAG
jgi:acyl carrier protein